jgi:hypothetical protein
MIRSQIRLQSVVNLLLLCCLGPLHDDRIVAHGLALLAQGLAATDVQARLCHWDHNRRSFLERELQPVEGAS